MERPSNLHAKHLEYGRLEGQSCARPVSVVASPLGSLACEDLNEDRVLTTHRSLSAGYVNPCINCRRVGVHAAVDGENHRWVDNPL
jgi:hypothetical protein